MMHLPIQGIISGAVSGPTVLFYDTFDDADSTSLPSHTPNIDTVGGGWLQTATLFTISSNRATGTSGTNDYAYADVGASDGQIDTIANCGAANTSAGVIARSIGTNLGWWRLHIKAGFNSSAIEESFSGSYAIRASGTPTIAQSTDYDLTAIMDGTTLTFKVDGANEISYASATSGLTNTKHGIRSGGSETRHDNFTVTSL